MGKDVCIVVKQFFTVILDLLDTPDPPPPPHVIHVHPDAAPMQIAMWRQLLAEGLAESLDTFESIPTPPVQDG